MMTTTVEAKYRSNAGVTDESCRSPESDIQHQQCLDHVNAWFQHAARDFPWRHDDASPWGILVSEIMSQQTPMKRVEPRWREWMQKWPRPVDVAHASQAEILVAWGNLGYPRRALRLHECAQVIVERYDGEVPASYSELVELPGVGDYTAAAVMCFAFQQRALVLDTNIRRVLLRVFDGVDQVESSMTKAERLRHQQHLPTDREESVVWNKAVMELGALICQAQNPDCSSCPLTQQCLFKAQGLPLVQRHAKPQAWAGTDRQARGRVLAKLRKLHKGQEGDSAQVASMTRDEAFQLATVSHDTVEQPQRVMDSLLRDGLVVYANKERTRLALP